MAIDFTDQPGGGPIGQGPIGGSPSGDAALEGTTSATGTLVAALTLAIALIGATTGTAALAGTLGVTGNPTVSAAAGSYAVTGATATLERAKPITPGAYAVTGTDVAFEHVVFGTEGSYTVTGTAATLTRSASGALVGATTGTGTAVGAMTVTAALAGTAQATATAAGDLTTAFGPLALVGTTTGTGTAVGAMTVTAVLAGTTTATATADGVLTNTAPAALAGTTSATATATGTLTASVDRYATYALDALGVPYAGRLLNSANLEITRELADPLWSPVPDQSVTLEFDNADGALTDWYLANPRGRTVTMQRYDVKTGFLATRFIGAITWPRLAESRVLVDCAVLDRALFTEQIPAPVVTAAIFPSAVDLGATIPVPFGNVPNQPCPNVGDNKINSLFDYLIGHGPLVVTALARNGINDSLYSIQFSECVRAAGGPATSWAEVARTDLYPGYTVVRFILRQQDFNNGLHKIYAHVTAPTATRNFARAIGEVLSNTTWGLRQPVNASSVTAAAAVLDALPVPLYCDGAMLASRPAQEWLSDLLMVRGMWLDRNAQGEITIQVDQPAIGIAMVIGHDPDDGPRNIVEIGERSGPSPEERIRILVLKGRLDYIRNEYIAQAERAVNADGKTRTIEHAFLRDSTSLDLVADYLGKSIAAGQEGVPVTVTQEGRALAAGDIVLLTNAKRGYQQAMLKVWKIVERLTTLALTLRGWDWATYVYTPGAAISDSIAGTELDFSRTVPSAPSSLAITAQGTTLATDGRVSAFAVFAIANQSTNFKQTRLSYRLAGAATYVSGATSTTAGTTTMRLEGLLPGTSYDYQAVTENTFGLFSSGTTLLAQTTATDANVPSAPSAMAVMQAGARVVEIRVTASVPSDWGTTRLYRATSNVFGAATEIARGKKLSFHDQNVAYGTTYFYWARIEDQSGNLSGVSPSSGHSVTVVQIVTADITPGHVTTSTIAAGAVTNVQYVVHSGVGTSRNATQGLVDLGSGSVSITTTGGPVQVVFSGHWRTTNGDAVVVSAGVYLQLQRDGSMIQEAYDQRTHNVAASSGDQTRATVPVTIVDLPSAGSHTYKVQWLVFSNVPSSLVTSLPLGHTLEVIEMKR